jgi:hypothetical protein
MVGEVGAIRRAGCKPIVEARKGVRPTGRARASEGVASV